MIDDERLKDLIDMHDVHPSQRVPGSVYDKFDMDTADALRELASRREQDHDFVLVQRCVVESVVDSTRTGKPISDSAFECLRGSLALPSQDQDEGRG